MTFIRELISQQSIHFYHLTRYQQILPCISKSDTYWAIDRQRQIYLINLSFGGISPETYKMRSFILGTIDQALLIYLDMVLTKVDQYHWLETWFSPMWISLDTNLPALNAKKVLMWLKEALMVYKFPGQVGQVEFEMDFIF